MLKLVHKETSCHVRSDNTLVSTSSKCDRTASSMNSIFSISGMRGRVASALLDLADESRASPRGALMVVR